MSSGPSIQINIISKTLPTKPVSGMMEDVIRSIVGESTSFATSSAFHQYAIFDDATGDFRFVISRIVLQGKFVDRLQKSEDYRNSINLIDQHLSKDDHSYLVGLSAYYLSVEDRELFETHCASVFTNGFAVSMDLTPNKYPSAFFLRFSKYTMPSFDLLAKNNFIVAIK